MFNWLRKLATKKPGPTQGSAEYARRLLAQSWEAYRLARRDRPQEANQPHAFSGDAAILSSHDMMGRRARDLVRNTAQGKRIRQAFVDLVVGTGFQTFCWPFAPSELLEITTELETLQAGDLGPRLSYAMESDDLWEEYSSDPKQFDAEERLCRMDVERMLLGEAVTVGNGLLVRSMKRSYSLVPLCYQLIERDQLDESSDRPASKGHNKIVGGVELDSMNRTVAYHVYLDHPHEYFGSTVSPLLTRGGVPAVSSGGRRVRIPAERVIDLALYDRPSSSLGASWYDAVGQTSFDRDNYISSEIQSAAVDAAFAIAAYLADGHAYGDWGLDDDQTPGDSYGNTEIKVGNSPVAVNLNKDDKLEMVRQTRPNSGGVDFLGLLDRDTAAGMGLSYYTVTGNYENTNFSSSRAAKLDEDLRIQPLQRWFANHVALRIRRDFNALAAVSGLFSTLSPSEFRRNVRTYQRFDAIGNGRDLLDPYKEGEARTTRLRTGLSTFKEECARRNQHWIRVLLQLAIEQRVSQMFGVDLNFSKSGSQQAREVADGEQASEAA